METTRQRRPVPPEELARRIVGRRAGRAGTTVLPTERQLAVDLGVTRSAVRHALGLLAAEGRVSRQVGRGTYLLPGPARGPSVADIGTDRQRDEIGVDDIGPADVMSARRLLEPRLLPLVVLRATERDFHEMARCLDGGDRATAGDEFEAWDLALHRAIVTATHNPVVLRMYGPVEAARRGRLWGNLKRRGDSAPRRAERRREHHELVVALRAREPDRAVAAMVHHLDRVEANLLGTAADERNGSDAATASTAR